MRVLVTGADGFLGRHLCPLLRESGEDVIELRGPHAEAHALDVTDADAFAAAVRDASPDAIVHLAGFSSAGRSHEEPVRAFEINAGGTLHLVMAVKQHAPRARVLVLSSAECYGPLPAGTRASEAMPLVPLNPYAASKCAAETMALTFQRAYRLDVVVARLFHQIGPGQETSFVLPSFASQALAIRKNPSAPAVLRVGNIDVFRDFTHVEDGVRALRVLVERGEPGGIYNICSGEARSLGSVLDELLRVAGVTAAVEVDPARQRPADIPFLAGDPSRIEALGWRRQHDVRRALEDLLRHLEAA